MESLLLGQKGGHSPWSQETVLFPPHVNACLRSGLREGSWSLELVVDQGPLHLCFLGFQFSLKRKKSICPDTCHEILPFLPSSNCPNTILSCSFSTETRTVVGKLLWISSNRFPNFLIFWCTQKTTVSAWLRGRGQRWSVQGSYSPRPLKAPRESILWYISILFLAEQEKKHCSRTVLLQVVQSMNGLLLVHARYVWKSRVSISKLT